MDRPSAWAFLLGWGHCYHIYVLLGFSVYGEHRLIGMCATRDTTHSEVPSQAPIRIHPDSTPLYASLL